jgi:hypothetical protein
MLIFRLSLLFRSDQLWATMLVVGLMAWDSGYPEVAILLAIVGIVVCCWLSALAQK